MSSSTKKEYLIFSLVFLILPPLLFGNIQNLTNIFLSLFLVTLLLFLINFKSNENKNWPIYLSGFITGLFVSLFDLKIFLIEFSGSIISLSINSKSLAGLTSILGFCFFSSLYRQVKTLEYLDRFENNSELISRDKKINQILNKWFD